MGRGHQGGPGDASQEESRPYCRGHRCVGPCSPRRSGLQAQLRRRADVPDAESDPAGRPGGDRGPEPGSDPPGHSICLSPSPGGQAALHPPLPLPSPLRPHSRSGTHAVNVTSHSKAQASSLTPQSPGDDTSMLPLWGPTPTSIPREDPSTRSPRPLD